MLGEFDLGVREGDLVDGTGRPRFSADIGVREGRDGALRGRVTIEAKGLAVAPGFVDIHSHADWLLPLPRSARSRVCSAGTAASLGSSLR